MVTDKKILRANTPSDKEDVSLTSILYIPIFLLDWDNIFDP